MARKQKPEGATDKYFWRAAYYRTVPEMTPILKHVVAVALMTDLEFLPGSGLSQESLINALILWAEDLISRGHAAALEKELGPAFARLGKIVEADMKAQAMREPPAGGKAGKAEKEGFSIPKKGSRAKKGRPGPTESGDRKPRRPRNGGNSV